MLDLLFGSECALENIAVGELYSDVTSSMVGLSLHNLQLLGPLVAEHLTLLVFCN